MILMILNVNGLIRRQYKRILWVRFQNALLARPFYYMSCYFTLAINGLRIPAFAHKHQRKILTQESYNLSEIISHFSMAKLHQSIYKKLYDSNNSYLIKFLFFCTFLSNIEIALLEHYQGGSI